MNSTVTPSSSFSTGLYCDMRDITSDQYQELKFVNNIVNFSLAIIVGIIPLNIFSVSITFIGFLSLRNWKNPAKFYYYILSVSNLISLIFVDILTNLQYALLQLSYFWIGNLSWFYFISRFKIRDYNEIFCRGISLVIDVSPAWGYWTTALFALHRMFVVIYPLHVHKIKKIFNKWTLIAILVCLSLLYFPDIFTFYIIYIISPVSKNYMCMTSQLNSQSFWGIYFGQVNNFVKYLTSLIIIGISLSVISFKMTRANKNRSIYIRNKSDKASNSDRRANLTLILICSNYLLTIVPYVVVQSLMAITNNTCHTYMVFAIAENVSPVFNYISIIIRIFDGVIFFLMVPEFRRGVFNLFFCSFPTDASEK